jgi:5-formyltetrahydrofolate cyclo-ligase
MNPVEVKATVRAKMAEFRLRPDEREAASILLCARIQDLPSWSRARTVLTFSALPDEPCLDGLFCGKREFFFPRFHAGRGYTAAAVEALGELVPGKFGILEPPVDAPECRPENVDLVLVPGMAFDETGDRLGRGRGFYDRLLEVLAGVKVGVGFDHQLIEVVPTESHDVRLDAVVMPSRTID